MRKNLILIGMLLAAVFSASAQTGTWSGKLDVQSTKISLVFHLDGDNPTMDSPDQGVKGIPIEVARTATGSIIIKAPSIGATYEGLWLVKQIVGTFKQMGASLPLTLTPGEEKLNRPQTPQGPFPYAQEEVSFRNGDAVLRGTLVFADALARAGIATLRYDDRGFGESTGDIINCTTEDLKNDALAGIGLLRERFDKVGVIGHSEGGTIALMLAAEKKADFIVSLAGMVVSGKETLLWQNRIALAAAGVPDETANTYCKALQEIYEARLAGAPLPSPGKYDLPATLAQNLSAVSMQIQTPYLKYFLALDVRPLLGDVTCPVLALNGTKDTQVEPESNLGALRNGLSDNTKNSLEAIEGVNHLFQHCQTGSPNEYRDIDETFAPEVLEKLIQWISEQ